ncbi:MAG: GNAT family N-acetyltransferase [Bacteroidetes bacterium]|nr:GNAT family N-acetyltransferase [Bacteroidota bacterium]
MKNFPELQQSRVVLRKPSTEDSEFIFRLRSDVEVGKYLDRRPQTKLQEAEEFLKKIINGLAGMNWLYWIITEKDSGNCLGTICLWNFSGDRKSAEAGFEILPEYQGKGFASEALSAVLRYGFYELSLDKIDGFVESANLRSLGLMKKYGFSLAKELEEKSSIDGSETKCSIYTLAKEDYYLSS